MHDAVAPDPAETEPAVFDVRPCLRDPVFHLLKDRWRLSPLVGAVLFFVLYFGGNFLFAAISGTALPREGLGLSFVQDTIGLVLYAFLLPVGAFLALRFYGQAESAFERLHSDGVVRAPLDEYNAFLQKLHHRYNSTYVHIAALGFALVVFGYLTGYSYYDNVSAWLDPGMGVGAVYQLVVGLIAWYSLHLVLLKIVITAWAIQRIFDWPVNIQPLHPDGCCGFRLLTEIAVTIAFFMAVAGMGVALIALAGPILFGTPLSAEPVLIAVLLETLVPLIFFSCLYRAHRIMRAAKAEVLRETHLRFQAHFLALQEQLVDGERVDEAADEMMRLEAVHGFLRRLPVWPTNTQMLTQVFLSIALPLGLLLLQVVLEQVVWGGK